MPVCRGHMAVATGAPEGWLLAAVHLQEEAQSSKAHLGSLWGTGPWIPMCGSAALSACSVCHQPGIICPPNQVCVELGTGQDSWSLSAPWISHLCLLLPRPSASWFNSENAKEAKGGNKRQRNQSQAGVSGFFPLQSFLSSWGHRSGDSLSLSPTLLCCRAGLPGA